MKPLVTKQLIESIPTDPHSGLMFLCGKFRAWSESKEVKSGERSEKRILFLEAFHLLKHFTRDNNLETFVDTPKLDEKATEVVKATTLMYTEALEKITPFVSEREEQERVEAAETKVAQLLGKSFSYRFSEKDLIRIHELVRELRVCLENSEELLGSYHQRILRRLNQLETSLSETMGSLELFYVLLSDAAVLFHKLHDKSDQPVSVLKQIVGFAWRSQVNAEDLPSDSRLNIPIHASGQEHSLDSENWTRSN